MRTSSTFRARRGTVRLLIGLTILVACGQAEPSGDADPASASARQEASAHPEILTALREDLAAVRHPGDGGGRVWLESVRPETPRAGERAVFEFRFETGPEGIAVGGQIQFQVPPFWGWSLPQFNDPVAAAYTTVGTSAMGVKLTPRVYNNELLGIEVGGRALEPGEQVQIIYGAAPTGAQVDRYAERSSRFHFAVDADGDGIRKLLAEHPSVDIAPGAPARLVLRLPATARVGESVVLRASVLDAVGNAGVPYAASLPIALPPGLAGPETVEFTAEHAGSREVELRVESAGVHRIGANGPDGTPVESNPLRVAAPGEPGPTLLWGDLHGHSGLSDGTGTPEDYYAYARDVAGLDVVALTDHDHWGLPFLDAEPEARASIHAATRRFHAPKRFVTLHGYEWTNWVHGHRHVLFFDDSPQLWSSVDPDYDEPGELWEALRGRDALTFAHHSAGGPVATDWSIPPDPSLEPVTEIVSVHGSSEALDSPGVIYRPIPGNFVRDVLARGQRLGFVGSGDGHDGHPGLAHLGNRSGGVAGIYAEEATRASVLAALRARRVYATNGPRIVLHTDLAGQPMGSVVPASSGTAGSEIPEVSETAGGLEVEVAAVHDLDRIDLIGRDGVIESRPLEGRDAQIRFEIGSPGPGDFRYVRVVQRNGGAAWSSPYFF